MRYLTYFIFCCWLTVQVQGHGRLLEPPSRSSMWRFGYDTPRNYDDNELFCGGIYIIKVTIDLTANHLGYFEFRICPNNNTKKIVGQSCLDKYPLQLADGSGTRFHVESRYLGLTDIKLRLPKDLTCSQCVLQWEYRGENNWGLCSNGMQKLGCGPQETFRSCADVAIHQTIKN
ncbi:hypothetical protein AVEN_111646-1 [Araneus ventricosus]|uniref:Chitin-binding type-4 domain-containing protein n=1 Tax=Araneus ventricosus TaxID=182803 RepID=A0A4Y2C4J7_ARAVE|nr:hypothetical protein AVEN_111646-1 [Araneus ventricosus]